MSLGLEIVLTSKDLAMSKDDLLFKNVMNIFAVVGALGIGLPLLYFVMPGLVTSLLMLGAIGGAAYGLLAFLANTRNSAAIALSSNHPNQFLDDLSYTARSAGKSYGSESFGMCPEDD